MLVTERLSQPANNLAAGPLEKGLAPTRRAGHITHSRRCLLCGGLRATACTAAGPLLHLRQLNERFPGSGREWKDGLRQRRRRAPTTTEATLPHICLSRVDICSSSILPGPGFDTPLVRCLKLHTELLSLKALFAILQEYSIILHQLSLLALARKGF
jgi:hypothetical protein